MAKRGVKEVSLGSLEQASRVHVISHVDLDGIASAALLVRWSRVRGKRVSWDIVGVRGLYRVLVNRMRQLLGLPGRSVVVVCDVSPRESEARVYASLIRPGKLELIWFDHHEWPNGVREYLEKNAVTVVHDRSDVTAALVHKTLEFSDAVAQRLVELARRDDSCSRDPEGLVEKWRLVLRLGSRQDLERAVQDLADGKIWPQWANEVYMNNYQEYYKKVKTTAVSTYTFEGFRVAVAVPPPDISACDLDLMGVLPGPNDADVVVIVYPRGLSIRTWGRLRANCIAEKLGGGGHSHAAGAPRPSQSMGSAQIARLIAKTAAACR